MRTAAPAPQPVFVQQPCHEDYHAMNTVPGGKFCGACQHVVTDFTGWKQEEIVLYLRSRGSERSCGRFLGSQLGATKAKRSLLTAIKVSVLAALALFLSKGEAKAQQTTAPVAAPGPNVFSDSVVLLVRGEVKSGNRTVRGANVIAINQNGDTIAESKVSSGRFELNVPIGYPQEPFTIVASAPGFKVFTLKNYVSSAGNVIGIEMEAVKKKKRRYFSRRPHYTTVGCPSF